MLQGDLSLSAEDKPPPIMLSNIGASGSQPTIRSDHDGDDYSEEDEEPHSWLEGQTAVKFLLAGGIAGASKLKLHQVMLHYRIAPSLQNVHGALRSAENLSNHTAPRSRWRSYLVQTKRQ